MSFVNKGVIFCRYHDKDYRHVLWFS